MYSSAFPPSLKCLIASWIMCNLGPKWKSFWKSPIVPKCVPIALLSIKTVGVWRKGRPYLYVKTILYLWPYLLFNFCISVSSTLSNVLLMVFLKTFMIFIIGTHKWQRENPTFWSNNLSIFIYVSAKCSHLCSTWFQQ